MNFKILGHWIFEESFVAQKDFAFNTACQLRHEAVQELVDYIEETKKDKKDLIKMQIQDQRNRKEIQRLKEIISTYKSSIENEAVYLNELRRCLHSFGITSDKDMDRHLKAHVNTVNTTPPP